MISKLRKEKFFSEKGQLTLQLLIFGSVAVVILSGFVLWIDTNLKGGNKELNRAVASMIAESGLEYYRWHLAHDPQDFQDGTGAPGPYTHEFIDKDGKRIGEFILDITAPEEGSTITVIRSTGNVDADSFVQKILEVRMGLPSFAQYSAVANADIRFGEGTEVFGRLHSNGGIRFDGLAHNLVTSAKDEYNDPDHSGNKEFGVHTHVAPTDPLPPSSAPLRPDVFEVGRDFPVPEVDFDGITQDLALIKADAETDGFYTDKSNNEGYEVVLKTDGTFDLYEVTSQKPRPQHCLNYGWYPEQDGWDTWTIQTKQFVSNNNIPDNGLIFIEDDVWVSGQVNNAKVTVASAEFPDIPSKRTSIIINSDLTYTNYDGTDSIALIAQKDVSVGLVSEDDLRIDGALVAQNGRVGRFYYIGEWGNKDGCSPDDTKTKITLFGMIATNRRYGFAYTDGTGYQERVIIYDANLLYGPPPSFPLTGATYETLSWDEIK
jgi:hypothetical protein